MKLILNKYIFVSLVFILAFTVIGYSITYSYFNDVSAANNNTFTAASVFPTTTPSVTQNQTVQPGDVVINEINWAGSSLSGDDEWLELRNTTPNPIDLAGWKITGAISGVGDLSIPTGTIQANGYFLISNFAETASEISIIPDLVTTAIQLDNVNAQYILKDNFGNIVDTADDGSSNPLAGDNMSPKKSMERKTPQGDGTQASNWHNSNAHTNMDGAELSDEFGTPKAINSTP